MLCHVMIEENEPERGRGGGGREEDRQTEGRRERKRESRPVWIFLLCAGSVSTMTVFMSLSGSLADWGMSWGSFGEAGAGFPLECTGSRHAIAFVHC